MASWYDVGTVSVTNGSATVTGSGTDFLTGARVGDGFLAPDGNLYEISAIGGATSLTLGQNYNGSTTSGAAYSVVPTQALTGTLADNVATLISDYQSGLDSISSGVFKAANGSVSAPGVTFANDLNTGLYSIADNNLGVAVSGVKVLDLVSTGVNANLRFLDSKKLTFGTSDDLQIYHDGSNTFIKDVGTGNLNICGTNINFLTGDESEYLAQLITNGAFNLFYDGVVKLSTTANGVNVNGKLDLGTQNSGTGKTLQFNAAGGGSHYINFGEGTIDDIFQFVYNGIPAAPSNDFRIRSEGKNLVVLKQDGDFNLYEDTGSSVMLFWDASAESLKIGHATSVYSARLDLVGLGNGVRSPILWARSGTGDAVHQININATKLEFGYGDTTDTSPYAEFDGSGNLSLNSGNLVIGTAGKGIDFSANSNAAGMTSELLDDYEEGTWTPTIVGASSGSITGFTVVYAKYTKVGNLVTGSVYLTSINMTTSTVVSSYKVGGLPFTSTNTGHPVSCAYCNMFTFDESTTNIGGFISGTAITLLKGSSVVAPTDADTGTGTAASIMLNFSYQTS